MSRARPRSWKRKADSSTLRFSSAPGLHPAPLDELQIAKQGGDDPSTCSSLGGEAKAHAKVLEVGAADAAAGGELIDPAPPLEQGEAAFPQPMRWLRKVRGFCQYSSTHGSGKVSASLRVSLTGVSWMRMPRSSSR